MDDTAAEAKYLNLVDILEVGRPQRVIQLFATCSAASSAILQYATQIGDILCRFCIWWLRRGLARVRVFECGMAGDYPGLVMMS